MNIEHKSTNEKQEKTTCQIFFDKISSEISDTISNPNENLTKKLDSIINKSFKLISKNDLKNPEIQKEVFEQIIKFLNDLFWKIDAKKFYNNIPKTDIQKYSEKSLWEEFMHNIYWKNRQTFYIDEVWWWDCYYRTVLFKKFFDELSKKWLNIQSDIFLYNLDSWWHAWVIITFQNKDYIVDIWWIPATFGLTAVSLEDLNRLTDSKWFNNFSRNNINKQKEAFRRNLKKRWLIFFSNTTDFISKISEKNNQSATIEFNPDLDWEWSKNVKFEFYPNKICLMVDNIQHIFLYKKNTKSLKNIPDEKFFDYFISQIKYLSSNDKATNQMFISSWEKSTFTKYLNLIRKKISIQKLRKIYEI